MDYRIIDMENYPRRRHFSYFSSMRDPYVGLTVQMNVSGFVDFCKSKGYPFFLSFLYCVGRSVNSVPELKQRILDGKIVEFSRCDTSHTVLRDNGTYGYCRLNPMEDFDSFLKKAVELQENARNDDSLDDGDDAISLIFVSSMHWLTYTDLHQPTPYPADSNPRIVWGKYQKNGDTTTMPVSLLANHALVDGLHIAQFYHALEQNIKDFIIR